MSKKKVETKEGLSNKFEGAGLEHLRKKTIKKLEKLGLLEGFEAPIPENTAKLFESPAIQKINDDDGSK